MTYENQLDEALDYLNINIQKDGTFLFYDKVKSDWNDQANYLFKHLAEIGISEKLWLPLILHLYKEGNIDLAWDPKEDEQEKKWPNQIKIMYQGVMLISNGGYTQKKEDNLTIIKATNDRNQRMERNEEQLVTWTQNLANRTANLTYWTRLVAIGAIGLVLWEITHYLLDKFF